MTTPLLVVIALGVIYLCLSQPIPDGTQRRPWTGLRSSTAPDASSTQPYPLAQHAVAKETLNMTLAIVDRLEAERDRYRDALERIAVWREGWTPSQIARDALDGPGEASP